MENVMENDSGGWSVKVWGSGGTGSSTVPCPWVNTATTTTSTVTYKIPTIQLVTLIKKVFNGYFVVRRKGNEIVSNMRIEDSKKYWVGEFSDYPLAYHFAHARTKKDEYCVMFSIRGKYHVLLGCSFYPADYHFKARRGEITLASEWLYT